MKKILLILVTGTLTIGLVGCGNKEVSNKTESKNVVQEEKHEPKQEKGKTVDLKNSEIEKSINNLISPLKVSKIVGSVVKNNKGLLIKFEVGEGDINQKIKDFYMNSSIISGVIGSHEEYNYKQLLILNDELGGFLMYTAKEDLANALTLDSARFSNKKYEEMFNKLREEK